ncbi:MAG: diacylglycerol/lipid kinase family protein [Actinomycetota bacterium]
MARSLLISNAASGGADGEILEGMLAVLRDEGPVTHVAPSSLDRFVDEVSVGAEGAELVIVAGGDGTMNHAVNALSDRLDEIVFGLVPMGTGNDLARTFEISTDPSEGLRAILTGTERNLDVCLASSNGVRRLFVNASIGGFPVQVSEGIDERLKRAIGPPAYAVTAVKEASNLERFTAIVNGVTIEECVAVGVGNGKTCGGGTRVWPDADPGDGALDVCALSADGLGELLKVGMSVKSGKHVDDDRAFVSRGREITIDALPTIELNVDGELLGLKTSVTFSVVARTRIKAPPL